MNKLLRNACRLLMSALLLLVTLAVVQALIRFPWEFDRRRLVMPLAAGFGAGLLFFILVSRLLVLYVFGHELTHWLAAKLFMRKTGPFRVGRARGSVAIERPNIWIVLAPYFIPVYALMVLGAYGITDFCWPARPDWLVPATAAAVGVAYAFHLRLTVFALSREQSDLGNHGRMLSFAVIVLGNVLLLYLSCMAATRQWHAPAVLAWGNLQRNLRWCLSGLSAAGACHCRVAAMQLR